MEAVVNTDRELWREVEGDAYAPSIHVTEDGMIGIKLHGRVILKDVRNWFYLAEAGKECEEASSSLTDCEPEPTWKYTQYLQILIEIQKTGHDVHKEINDTLKKLHELIFKEGA